MLKRFLFIAIIFSAASTTLLFANDSAASVAAGGIQLKREARIAMKSEKLFISQEKVRVEYEFLNESTEDITTEVAFPIPEYEFDIWSAGGMRPFDDFRVWVEGKELKHRIDAKALLDKRDVSDLLRRYNVDISSFGHFDEKKETSPDFNRLSASAKSQLRKAGLFWMNDAPFPKWKVQKTYYWEQTFPAGKSVHIKHEYTPGFGFTPTDLNELQPSERKKRIEDAHARLKLSRTPETDRFDVQWAEQFDAELTGACIEQSLLRRIEKVKGNASLEYIWVDYILTTANSWKTPIEDFELIVEKTHRVANAKEFVSFCWDGPVQKLDPTHFVARAKDFVPKRELHVAFFEVQ